MKGTTIEWLPVIYIGERKIELAVCDTRQTALDAANELASWCEPDPTPPRVAVFFRQVPPWTLHRGIAPAAQAAAAAADEGP